MRMLVVLKELVLLALLHFRQQVRRMRWHTSSNEGAQLICSTHSKSKDKRIRAIIWYTTTTNNNNNNNNHHQLLIMAMCRHCQLIM